MAGAECVMSQVYFFWFEPVVMYVFFKSDYDFLSCPVFIVLRVIHASYTHLIYYVESN